jgi:hypothetical protein
VRGPRQALDIFEVAAGFFNCFRIVVERRILVARDNLARLEMSVSRADLFVCYRSRSGSEVFARLSSAI